MHRWPVVAVIWGTVTLPQDDVCVCTHYRACSHVCISENGCKIYFKAAGTLFLIGMDIVWVFQCEQPMGRESEPYIDVIARSRAPLITWMERPCTFSHAFLRTVSFKDTKLSSPTMSVTEISTTVHCVRKRFVALQIDICRQNFVSLRHRLRRWFIFAE